MDCLSFFILILAKWRVRRFKWELVHVGIQSSPTFDFFHVFIVISCSISFLYCWVSLGFVVGGVLVWFLCWVCDYWWFGGDYMCLGLLIHDIWLIYKVGLCYWSLDNLGHFVELKNPSLFDLEFLNWSLNIKKIISKD